MTILKNFLAWHILGEGKTFILIYWFTFHICRYLKIPMPKIKLSLTKEACIHYFYETETLKFKNAILELGLDFFFDKQNQYKDIFPYIGKTLYSEKAKLLFIIGHELGHYLTMLKYPKLADKCRIQRFLIQKTKKISNKEYREIKGEKIADKIGLAIVKLWGYT